MRLNRESIERVSIPKPFALKGIGRRFRGSRSRPAVLYHRPPSNPQSKSKVNRTEKQRMKRILKRIEAHKKEIAESWLRGALEVYPRDTRNAYAAKKNRFTNPVGQTLEEGLNRVLDELVADADGETLSHCLAEIVRIRSVQDMRPSTALSFLFLLKNVISRVLKNDLRKPSVARELEWVEKRIDSMALFTFDLYSRCRERVYEVRVNDIKRNVSSLLKRSSFFNSDSETDSNPDFDLNLKHEPGKDLGWNRKRGGGR